jgi:hypothetical protein
MPDRCCIGSANGLSNSPCVVDRLRSRNLLGAGWRPGGELLQRRSIAGTGWASDIQVPRHQKPTPRGPCTPIRRLLWFPNLLASCSSGAADRVLQIQRSLSHSSALTRAAPSRSGGSGRRAGVDPQPDPTPAVWAPAPPTPAPPAAAAGGLRPRYPRLVLEHANARRPSPDDLQAVVEDGTAALGALGSTVRKQRAGEPARPQPTSRLSAVELGGARPGRAIRTHPALAGFWWSIRRC